MNCQPPDERLLKDLIRRVKALEAQIGPWNQIMGVDTTPEQSIVPVISVVQTIAGSSQMFTLVWQSSPGEQFSIQTSRDTMTWESVYSPFPAAPSPATITTWTSDGFLIDDLPRYFRVRRYPVAFAPCGTGAQVFCVMPAIGTNPPPEGSYYLTPDGGIYMTPNGGIYLTPS